MQKNFRKIPPFINGKLENLGSNLIEVCAIIKLKESDIEKPEFRNLGLHLKNGELVFHENFIPPPAIGRFCKKNAFGYKIFHHDLPKVFKTFYCGERPYYGDWKKGSFSLYVTRKVKQYDFIPAKEHGLKVAVIDRRKAENEYTLKVSIDAVFDRNQPDFSEELLFAINILQESVFSCDVFPHNSSREDYLKTLNVNWEIFPPGEKEDDLSRIIIPSKRQNKEFVKKVEDRYDYIKEFNPKVFINGTSGMRHYFGAKIADNLVIFENTNYGNAVYVLFEDWETLSRLSRTEIQNRPEKDYIRVPHLKNWKSSLKTLIQERLNA